VSSDGGYPKRRDDVLGAPAGERYPEALPGGAFQLIHAFGGPAEWRHVER
jgi:hypothetical protein